MTITYLLFLCCSPSNVNQDICKCWNMCKHGLCEKCLTKMECAILAQARELLDYLGMIHIYIYIYIMSLNISSYHMHGHPPYYGIVCVSANFIASLLIRGEHFLDVGAVSRDHLHRTSELVWNKLYYTCMPTSRVPRGFSYHH